MEHLAEKYSVLVLDFAETLHVLHFLLVVIHDVRRLGRLAHIDLRLDAPQTLHVHDVLLDLLPVRDEAIGPALVEHLSKFKIIK